MTPEEALDRVDERVELNEADQAYLDEMVDKPISPKFDPEFGRVTEDRINSDDD